MEKHPSVVEALAALRARFGDELTVVDHWEGDLMAIGVARADALDCLVYLSTAQRAPGRYYVDLELPAPSGSDLPYQQGERFADVDFDKLVDIVSRHLGLRVR